MANDRQAEIKETSRQIKSPWLMNTLKSMGTAGNAVMKSLTPVISSSSESASKTVISATKNIRQGASVSSVKKSIMGNPAIKTGQEFLNNALDDIKSGNLYNTDREASDFGSDMFGDIDEMFNEGDTNVVINEGSSSAEMEQIGASMNKFAEYQIQTTKATVDTMVSLSSVNLVKMTELGDKVVNQLTDINSSLKAIVEFNNSNMTKFIEASIGYYGQSLEDNTPSKRLGMGDIINSKGGLDFGAYGDLIKQNFSDAKNDNLAISMGSMLLDNKEMFLTNPVGMILETAIKATIPMSVKKSLEVLDNTVKDAIPVMLEQIAGLGAGEAGITGEVLKFIGKTFGVKVKSKKEIDIAGSLKKGPMPYNAEVNQTIMEIIPKYLRESNSYLKEIALSMTGKNLKQLNSDVEGFNWDTNRFEKLSEMQANMYDSILFDVTNTFNNSEFGKAMVSLKDTALQNEADKEVFAEALNKFYIMYERNSTNTDLYNPDTVSKLIDDLSDYSESIRSAIKGQIEAYASDPNNTMLTNARAARSSASARKQNTISSMERGASEGGNLQQVLSFGDDYDTYALNRYKSLTRDSSAENIDRSALHKSSSSNSGLSHGGQFASNAASVFQSFISGDSGKIERDIAAGLTSVFTKSADVISKHFLMPFRKVLFGDKDENGYREGGLFHGAENMLKESYFSFRKAITGKGYTKADGTTVDDANEDEMKDTMLGRFKSMVSYIKDSVKVKLFGDDEEGDDAKIGVIGKFTAAFKDISGTMMQGLSGWKTALFGEGNKSPEEEGKEITENVMAKAKEYLPSGFTGSIAGGLIGTLVGGPVAGAMIGFAGGIASRSDKFMTWLFGEKDDQGKRLGGIISANTQEFMQKNSKLLVGAGVVGAGLGILKGAAFSMIGPAGALSMLAGGPLTGAILGIGGAILSKSQMFQEFLFGKPEAGRKGIVNSIKDSFGSFTSGITLDKKSIGMGAIGAIGGAGAAIGTMGILGLAMGPAGPIGGAILGLGTSILAQKKGFKEWLFGTTEDDGTRKEGILGKAKNMIITSVLMPVSDAVKSVGRDIRDFTWSQLTKIQIMAQPLFEFFGNSMKKIGNRILDTGKALGDSIKATFMDGLVPMLKNIAQPITSAAIAVGKTMYGFGKQLAGLPVNLLFNFTKMLTHPITQALKGTMNILGKGIKTVLAPFAWAGKKIFSLATGITKLVGNVLAAPFKLINWVGNKVLSPFVKFGQHVNRFFIGIGSAIQNKVAATFDAWKNKATDIFKLITSPFVEFGKQAITEIKETSKAWLSKAGSWVATKVSNLIFGTPEERAKKQKAKDEADTKKRSDKDYIRWWRLNNPTKDIGAAIGRMWEQTRDGYYLPDMSGRNVSTYGKMQYFDKEEKNKKMERDAKEAEDKKRTSNSQKIAKATNYQFYEDTAENRAKAQAMSKGKKIKFDDIDPIDVIKEREAREATIKMENINNEVKDNTAQTNEHLANIETSMNSINQILENGVPVIQGSRSKKKAQVHRKGKGSKNTSDEAVPDTSNEPIENVDDVDDGGYVRTKADDIMDELKANTVGGFAYKPEGISLKKIGIGFKNAFSMAKTNRAAYDSGSTKGGYEIDNNYDGTDSARAGYSMVGELGPEVLYRPDSMLGQFVGLNGPEIVKMQGGEKVIPNHEIPKDTSDVTGGLSDLTNDNLMDESSPEKLSIFERILRELISIKRNTDDDTTNNTVTGIAATLNPFKGMGIGKTEAEKDAEAVAKREANEAAAMGEVTSLTSEKMRAERDALEEGESEISLLDKIKNGVLGTFATMKHHSSIFDGIFSKEGLITGALIAAVPLLISFFTSDFGKILGDGIAKLGESIMKVLPGVLSTVATAIEFVGGAITLLGEGLGHAIDFLGLNNETYNTYGGEDGQGTIESISQFGTQMGDVGSNLLNFDLGGAYNSFVYDEHGNETAYTREAQKFLITRPNKFVRKTTNNLTQKFLNNQIEKEATEKAIKEAVEKANKEAAEKAASSTSKKVTVRVANKTGKKIGTEIAEEVGGEVAEKIGTEILDKTAGEMLSTQNKTIFNTFQKLVKQAGEEVIEFVTKKLGIVGKKILPEIFEKALASIGKQIGRWVTKIATKLGIKLAGAIVSVGITEAIGAGIGALGGASNPRNLFYIPPDAEPDGTMYAIATGFGALLGTTPGAAIDLINEIWASIAGQDFLSAAATGIYKLCKSGDEEALKEFEQQQQNFANEYAASVENTMRIQYNNLKNSGGIGADVTFEQFVADKDQHNISMQSQVEYNDAHNKDMWSSIGDWFGNLFTGGEDKVDMETGIYYKNEGNGQYTAYDKEGNNLGTTTKEELEFTTAENMGIMSDIQFAVGSAIENNFKYPIDLVTNQYNNIAGTIDDLLSNEKSVAEKIGSVFQTSIAVQFEPLMTMFDNIAGDTEEIYDRSASKVEFADMNEKIRANIANSKGSTGGFGTKSGTTMNGIPYYSQNDPEWADNRYGDDGATMSEAGCGPAAMSMVLSDMTGKQIDPRRTATDAINMGMRDETGTNSNFISSVSDKYGIGSTRLNNPSTMGISSMLDSGNPVVMLGSDDGSNTTPYTDGGHYVVATGIDSNGNVTYNDPLGQGKSGKSHINKLASHTASAWEFGKKGGKGRSRRRVGGSGYWNPLWGEEVETEDPAFWSHLAGIPTTPTKQLPEPTMNSEASKVVNAATAYRQLFENLSNKTPASTVIELAVNELGYRAKSSENDDLYNKTLYSDNGVGKYTKYNKELDLGSYYSWVVSFIKWIIYKASLDNKTYMEEILCIQHSNDKSPSQLINGFEEKGLLVFDVYEAMPGDIIFKELTGSRNGTSGIKVDKDYIGIVVISAAPTLTVIRGNVTTGEVIAEEIDASESYIFGKPLYGGTGANVDYTQGVLDSINSVVTDAWDTAVDFGGDIANGVSTVAKGAWDILTVLSDVVTKGVTGVFNHAMSGNTGEIDWTSIFAPDTSEYSNLGSSDIEQSFYGEKNSNIPNYLLDSLSKSAGYNVSITSPYGVRYDPEGSGNLEGHKGIDIGAPAGTVIHSPVSGIVAHKQVWGTGGNAVRIQDPYGYIHENFHLVEPSHLNVGDEVTVGQNIGLVGSTGRSTGNHLHYGIKDPNNQPIDPYTYSDAYFDTMWRGNASSSLEDLYNTLGPDKTESPYYRTNNPNETFVDASGNTITAMGEGKKGGFGPKIGGYQTKKIEKSNPEMPKATLDSSSTLQSYRGFKAKGSGPDTMSTAKMEELLEKVVVVLERIGTNSDELKGLKDLKANPTIITNQNNTSNNYTASKQQTPQLNNGKRTSVGKETARKIALG